MDSTSLLSMGIVIKGGRPHLFYKMVCIWRNANSSDGAELATSNVLRHWTKSPRQWNFRGYRAQVPRWVLLEASQLLLSFFDARIIFSFTKRPAFWW